MDRKEEDRLFARAEKLASRLGADTPPTPPADGDVQVMMPSSDSSRLSHTEVDALTSASDSRVSLVDDRSPNARNPVTHGGYIKGFHVIDLGPLKEDREEVLAFYRGVDADLNPGQSMILQAQALEIAGLQWSLRRLQKWASRGYSVLDGQLGDYEPDRRALLAERREGAAKTLSALEDADLDRDEVRDAFINLVEITLDRDDSYNEFVKSIQSRDKLLALLRDFVSEHYKSMERAVEKLRLEVKSHRDVDRELRSPDSRIWARHEMSSDFTRSHLDAIARTSRELDRALARYRLTKQTLDDMGK